MQINRPPFGEAAGHGLGKFDCAGCVGPGRGSDRRGLPNAMQFFEHHGAAVKHLRIGTVARPGPGTPGVATGSARGIVRNVHNTRALGLHERDPQARLVAPNHLPPHRYP